MLGLVDHACHNEEEQREVHHRIDHLLITAKKEAIGAKPRSELISMRWSRHRKRVGRNETVARRGCCQNIGGSVARETRLTQAEFWLVATESFPSLSVFRV